MAIDRNTPPSGSRVTTSSAGGNTALSGTTSGNVSGITGSSGSSSGNTSVNTSSRTNTSTSGSTTGNRTTNRTGTSTTTTKNMDPASLAALQQLIANLQNGGSPEDRQRWQQIQSEVLANQQQRQNYSKESALADADMAATARSYEALQQAIPAITAGIDSAGTSGSSMAALLTQNAADDAARLAAQLQLDASISYGQIANQSSSIIADLLKIENPTTSNLLAALNIAKGAVQTTTQKTNEQEVVNYFENTRSNSTQTNNTNQNTSTSSSGPSSLSSSNNLSGGLSGSGPSTQTAKFPNLSTPGSYR